MFLARAFTNQSHTSPLTSAYSDLLGFAYLCSPRIPSSHDFRISLLFAMIFWIWVFPTSKALALDLADSLFFALSITFTRSSKDKTLLFAPHLLVVAIFYRFKTSMPRDVMIQKMEARLRSMLHETSWIAWKKRIETVPLNSALIKPRAVAHCR